MLVFSIKKYFSSGIQSAEILRQWNANSMCAAGSLCEQVGEPEYESLASFLRGFFVFGAPADIASACLCSNLAQLS
jgi:hypothetical protein